MLGTKKEPDILKDIQREYGVARENCKQYFERMYKIVEFSMAVMIAVVGIDSVSSGSSYASNSFEYIIFLHIFPVCIYVLGILFSYNAYSLSVYGYEAHALKKRLHDNKGYGTNELDIMMNEYIKTKTHKTIISYGVCLLFYVTMPLFSILFACWRFLENAQTSDISTGCKCVDYVINLVHNPFVAIVIWVIYLVAIAFLIVPICVNFKKRHQKKKDTSVSHGRNCDVIVKMDDTAVEESERYLNDMCKFGGLLKKRWFLFAGCMVPVLLVVGVPLFINWTFSTTAWWDFLAVNWEAKDVLSYYGSALGFVGTVALGAITVYQTRKAHIQTEKANQLAAEALEQTQKANELAARMQKLEEARFLSMVSVENVRFRTVTAADLSADKVPFMFPHAQKTTRIDLTAGSNSSEYYVIDTIVKNSSEFHIGSLSAFANYLGHTWKTSPKRNGIAPNSQMNARILIPCTDHKPTSEYSFRIHIYFTNVFQYTTHLTLAIKDISNADGKYSYNYDIEKEAQEVI